MTYSGPADLTFAANETVLVEAHRVLIALSPRGVGALRISPSSRPSVIELIAALEAGPFTLSYHGGLTSCRLLRFSTREPIDADWEMVIVFEAV